MTKILLSTFFLSFTLLYLYQYEIKSYLAKSPILSQYLDYPLISLDSYDTNDLLLSSIVIYNDGRTIKNSEEITMDKKDIEQIISLVIENDIYGLSNSYGDSIEEPYKKLMINIPENGVKLIHSQDSQPDILPQFIKKVEDIVNTYYQ